MACGLWSETSPPSAAFPRALSCLLVGVPHRPPLTSCPKPDLRWLWRGSSLWPSRHGLCPRGADGTRVPGSTPLRAASIALRTQRSPDTCR